MWEDVGSIAARVIPNTLNKTMNNTLFGAISSHEWTVSNFMRGNLPADLRHVDGCTQILDLALIVSSVNGESSFITYVHALQFNCNIVDAVLHPIETKILLVIASLHVVSGYSDSTHSYSITSGWSIPGFMPSFNNSARLRIQCS